MSVSVMGRIFWTQILSLTDDKGETVSGSVAKLVLLAIGDNADDFGENSWQSFETVANKASIQRRSVIRAIQVLEFNGYIKQVGTSPYGTNNYCIMLEKLGKPPEKRMKIGRPKTSDPGSLVYEINSSGSDPGTPGSDPGTPGSDPGSPESSFKHPLKHPLNIDAEKEKQKSSDDDQAQKIWETVLGQIKMDSERSTFERRIRPTRALSFDSGLLIVGVRDDLAKDWLEDRLTTTAVRLLQGITNNADIKLQFSVLENNVA